MRISDWSSDVCSSDLWFPEPSQTTSAIVDRHASPFQTEGAVLEGLKRPVFAREQFGSPERFVSVARCRVIHLPRSCASRSEEHTSELQSLMRSSYAVFCLKKKKRINVLKSQVGTSVV